MAAFDNVSLKTLAWVLSQEGNAEPNWQSLIAICRRLKGGIQSDLIVKTKDLFEDDK